jgi:hypothetical protein
MSLATYIGHLRSNPSDVPNGASAAEVVAHAKSLGHDVSEADIKALAAGGKKDLDSAGGGAECYVQGITIVGV